MPVHSLYDIGNLCNRNTLANFGSSFITRQRCQGCGIVLITNVAPLDLRIGFDSDSAIRPVRPFQIIEEKWDSFIAVQTTYNISDNTVVIQQNLALRWMVFLGRVPDFVQATDRYEQFALQIPNTVSAFRFNNFLFNECVMHVQLNSGNDGALRIATTQNIFTGNREAVYDHAYVASTGRSGHVAKYVAPTRLDFDNISSDTFDIEFMVK